MIHIYCGDGKGKTTAGIGLCLRAEGNGLPVLFAQFLKDDTSGEIRVLKNLPGVELMHSDRTCGFTWNMTDDELKEQAKIFHRMLEQVEAWIDKKLQAMENMVEADSSEKEKTGIKLLVILDEIIPAIDCKLVEESVLFELMDKYDKNLVEFILTGRNPSEHLEEKADYISRIEAVKHPYYKGVMARQGVEY